MYCDTCGTALAMGIEEYGKRAERERTVECAACRYTPERAVDLLEEFSRRQTVEV